MSALFARLSAGVARLTGSPYGLLAAIVAALGSWAALGGETTLIWVSLLAWFQLFSLQASQSQDTDAIKALLREMVVDIAEVDEAAVAAHLEDSHE